MTAHDHSHHSHHAHTVSAEYNKAFFIAIAANGLFVILQIVYAHLAHSTSLFADAIHNLGDVLGLSLAWVGHGLLQKSPTDKTTYGMKKTSILAALANGILLVFTCGMIFTEAFYKLFSPSDVQAISVMIIASIGIVINSATAILFLRGSHDLNIRGAFLHLMYDAFISLGVVLAAVVIYYTGWQRVDPLVGMLIAILILKGTWTLFTDSFRLIIDGVPGDISVEAVRQLFLTETGVKEVHDLHVWAISTQENALSVHLWMPEHPLTDQARQILIARLKKEHGIHHTTIQVEQNQQCEDRCKDFL